MITQQNFNADINNIEVLGQMIRLHPSEKMEGGTILLKKKTFGPPVHFHPRQDELIQVKQGELDVLKGKSWYHIQAGQQIFIPKNTPHTFRNITSEDVVFDFTVTPKIGLTYLLLTLDELVKAGKLNSLKNFKSLLYLNQAMASYPSVTQSVNPPQWAVKTMAALGKMFGLSIEKEKFRAEFLRTVKIWRGYSMPPSDVSEELLEQVLF
jgi:quercetin dioxygenase-like cupin family protein